MDVQTWQDDVWPPVLGIYRDDRRNVFLDGNSNLVLLATHDMGTYYGGKVRGIWRGMINQTWEARIKLDCLTPGAWAAFWAVNEDPLPDGEVDVFEWYGNDAWAPGTTVHAASNGKTWEGRSIPGLVDGGWHTWRMHWGEDGFTFWRDYVDGAEPYFHVPPTRFRCRAGPTTGVGRSTFRATGCSPCSPSRSADPVAATRPGSVPGGHARRLHPCLVGAHRVALMT